MIEIIDETMSNAARVHSIERGKEHSEYTMIAFGGGAPLHAARLAGKLGIDRVLVPVGAGVGSAIGFLRAPVAYELVQSRQSDLGHDDIAALDRMLRQMANDAESVVRKGAADENVKISVGVDLRYRGQGHELTIALPRASFVDDDLARLRADFENRYGRVYGLTMPDAALEAISWSVKASTSGDPSPRGNTVAETRPAEPSGVRTAWDTGAGELTEHLLFWRDILTPGETFRGPAIVGEDETSTVVPSGFKGQVLSDGGLLLTRVAK